MLKKNQTDFFCFEMTDFFFVEYQALVPGTRADATGIFTFIMCTTKKSLIKNNNNNNNKDQKNVD